MGVNLCNCEAELECVQELEGLKLDGSTGIGIDMQAVSIPLLSCSGWTE